MGNNEGDKSISIRLTQTQERMLDEIRNNPNITKAKLAEALKVGKTTIDKGIAQLRRCGLIKRIGSNKSGYWKVNENI